MAVCAGITKSGTSITIQYNASDGTKGASFANAYTMQDVYDTDVANQWGVVKRLSPYCYFLSAGLSTGGAGTYFYMEGVSLEWADIVLDSQYCCYLTYGHVRIKSKTGVAGRNYCSFKSVYKYILIGRNGYPDNFEINGAVFSGMGLVYFNSGHYDNIYSLGNGFSYLCQYSNSVYLNNVIVDRGEITPSGNGFQPGATPVIANNIMVMNCGAAVMQYSTSFTLRNFKSINCTNDIYVLPLTGRPLATGIFIDSNVDFNKAVGYGAGSSLYVAKVEDYNISTFEVTIAEGGDANLLIKDKIGTVVYSEILTSENMSNKEIVFQYFYYENDSNYIAHSLLEEYGPFSIEVTKEGYDTLVIPNINVTPGQPTIIRGAMVPTAPEPPVISSLQIANPGVSNNDGSITIIAESGTQPYLYSLNGGNYQEGNVFASLQEGTYSVSVKDANDLTDTVAGIALKKTLLYNQTIVATVGTSDDIVVAINQEQNIQVTVTTEDVIIS